MRICTFRDVRGRTVAGVALSPVLDAPTIPTAEAIPAALSELFPRRAPSAANPAGHQLLPPIPEPPSVRDFMAFEAHPRNLREARGQSMPDEWYQAPAFYFSNPASCLGWQEPVRRAPGSARFDFEIEVAAVIGQSGRDVAPSDADEYVAGYVLMCDWSARDVQLREKEIGIGFGKAKDCGTTFGPWIVTPDELPWTNAGRLDVDVAASINGELVTQSSFRDMYWTFGDLVAQASSGASLRVGDVLGSGTVPRGCLWELNVLDPENERWLQDGDRVVIDAGPLGRIETRIDPALAPPPAHWQGPRTRTAGGGEDG